MLPVVLIFGLAVVAIVKKLSSRIAVILCEKLNEDDDGGE